MVELTALEIILEYVFPIAGIITGTIMFFAPYHDTVVATRKGTLGTLNPLPWIFMAGNTYGWLLYGILINNVFIFIGNGPGFLLSLWLNMQAVKIQYENQRREIVQKAIVDALVLEKEKIQEQKQKQYGMVEKVTETTAILCKEEQCPNTITTSTNPISNGIGTVNPNNTIEGDSRNDNCTTAPLFSSDDDDDNNNNNNNSNNSKIRNGCFHSYKQQQQYDDEIERSGIEISATNDIQHDDEEEEEDHDYHNTATDVTKIKIDCNCDSHDYYTKLVWDASTSTPPSSSIVENNYINNISPTPVIAQHEVMIVVMAFVWLCITGIIGYSTMFTQSTKEYILGISVNINLMFFYGAPLSTISTVVQTKNSSSIHIPTMVTNTFNGLFWGIYGIAVYDLFIAIPNILGALLGLIQIGLYIIFPRL